MTEAQINDRLLGFWIVATGTPRVRAPTLMEIWHEQERVAELDRSPLPTWEEVLAHFAWFFGEPASE